MTQLEQELPSVGDQEGHSSQAPWLFLKPRPIMIGYRTSELFSFGCHDSKIFALLSQFIPDVFPWEVLFLAR